MISEETLQNYCDLLTENHHKRYDTENYKSKDYFTYSIGKKYVRIIHMMSGKYQSAFCFVDFEGNLYKCEGWSKPAKDIRGHISKPILDLGGFYKR